ncbi:unnamed protein product [Psylliodes chrysocephalus]|uniref:Uncharacterized protein n=1 Tax=Psylliodes chrysocephalus TaxID=3402493 RepID=A0A9P0CHA3_9CUCU|nr:unnamed protein product [Psylliodes chrysocephala]
MNAGNVKEAFKTKFIPLYETSDNQSSPPESLTNDDSDNEDIQEEVDYLTPNENNVEKGKFLLVKVLVGLRKKTNYRYVAMVQNISEDETEVLGMKSLVEGRKDFSNCDDLFSIHFSDIIAVLTDPEMKHFDG